jgi:replication fork protection complex subunit Csm3/Swi3
VGIPKLRKIAKTRLKFRGKGHEFTDMSRLLNTYQIWLDDLYPRAKFRDALTMVEKVGHSKRMQITRRAWLDETKPFQKEPSPEPTLSNSNGPEASRGDVGDEDLFAEMMAENNAEQGSRPNDSTGDANPPAVSARQESSQNNDEPDEDELDQLLAEQSNTGEVQSRPTQARRGPFMDDIEDEEDDLDALLAEQGQVPSAMPSRPSTSKPQQHDDFAAEEEAMAGMEDMW